MPQPPPINNLLIRAASGLPTERTPVWVMRQAGRYLPEFRKLRQQYDFFHICRTPSLASQVTLQPIQRYPNLLDAAIIFSDILVIPQALGMTVIMNPAPYFPNPIIDTQQIQNLIQLPIDSFLLKSKLQYVYDAIHLSIDALQNKIPLIGFVGAPWTLFAYMTSTTSNHLNQINLNPIEDHHIKSSTKSSPLDSPKTWLNNHPDLSLQLLDKLAHLCAFHLIHQANAGCQVLQVFDSWAGDLSHHHFITFSLPFLRKIATIVHQQLPSPPPPLIIFAKGINHPLQLQLLADSGYSTIGLDWKLDPQLAIQALGPLKSSKIALQGNLDPTVLLSNPQSIQHHVKLMLDPSQGGFHPHLPHIANLGHGITPSVDPESLKIFLQAVHDQSLQARLDYPNPSP